MRLCKTTWVLVVLWICGLSAPSLLGNGSPKPYILQTEMQGDPLGQYFLRYQDSTKKLTFEDLLELDRTGGMSPSSEHVPNFGLNPAVQWFKFTLRNPSDREILVLLENKFTFVDQFTLFYQNSSGTWLKKEAGDQIPYNLREVKSRQVVFKQVLGPGDHTFYARSKALGAHQLPLHIWTQESFYNHNSTEHAFIGILIGAHVVITLYNLFLFFSLRDPTYLAYVLYVASNLLYQTAGLGFLQQAGSELGLIETISNRVMILSVDLVAITALLFSWLFLNLKKRLPSFQKYYLAVLILAVTNLGITSLVSVELGTVICFGSASGATTVLILSGFLIARKGYWPATFYFVAWGFYLAGVSFTVSNLLGFIPTSELTRWGQFTGGAFEVAILSLALGARINEKRRAQVEQINELNRTLESKVKVRTAEIQSLLLHIPQGILSIGDQGKVGSNYSAQLADILGHKEIAGRSFRDLVLSHSKLSDDDKDQAWQSILASVNESTLNFEVNRNKLPSQLSYVYGSESKVLKLTWNTEVDEQDVIQHILVTLLDITSEVLAQQELDRKNQEFEIIRQLVEVGTKNSIQFFQAGNQLMEENARLIQAGDLTLDVIKILFVNAHTLKGAARSLHLKNLANEFHKIEAYYAAILREGAAIDPGRIEAEFKVAKSGYDRYLQANSEVLGRKEDHSRVPIERDFLQQNVKLLLQLSESHELPSDTRETIIKYREELTEMIFMSLQTILAETMTQADKVAKDLGKEPPHIHYDMDDILITHEQEIAIKKSFIHLLRNSLDHGVESGAVRQEQGKSPVGSIVIQAVEKEGLITIFFEDDGRGLAIGKLRSKGQALGILKSGASLEEVADVIFASGLSTADTVSLISGRGMGMSAVRQYMGTEKGTVDVVLGEPLSPDRSFYRFKIRITLPSALAKAHGHDGQRALAG